MNMTEMHGGSPYGASTMTAPDASRPISDLEKNLAKHQGEHSGKVFASMAAGIKAMQKNRRASIGLGGNTDRFVEDMLTHDAKHLDIKADSPDEDEEEDAKK